MHEDLTAFLRSLVFAVFLITIKVWSFGGFGLDKTYVLMFFEALAQLMGQMVLILGWLFKDGGRVLLNVSCLR